MLPILITVVVVAGVVAVVYFIGSQPSKKTSRSGQRPKKIVGGGSKGSGGPARRSAYRETPTWLRRLPLIFVIVAVVCLAVAVAQFRIAKQKATPVVVLVIDTSKSMDATDVEPDRLSAAQSAAQIFLSELPADFEVALVTFADEPSILVTPTADHGAVSQALGDLPRGTGTVIGDGLTAGLGAIETQWADTTKGPAAIVLLSDGRDTGSQVPPERAAEHAAGIGIPVYTVILGAQKEDGGGANTALLQEIAATTKGTASTSASSGQLSNIYGSLGSQLSSQLKISSSAQLFVFLAIAFAMAAALSLLVVTLMKQS